MTMLLNSKACWPYVEGLRSIAVLYVAMFHFGIGVFQGWLCQRGRVRRHFWLSDHLYHSQGSGRGRIHLRLLLRKAGTVYLPGAVRNAIGGARHATAQLSGMAECNGHCHGAVRFQYLVLDTKRLFGSFRPTHFAVAHLIVRNGETILHRIFYPNAACSILCNYLCSMPLLPETDLSDGMVR